MGRSGRSGQEILGLRAHPAANDLVGPSLAETYVGTRFVDLWDCRAVPAYVSGSYGFCVCPDVQRLKPYRSLFELCCTLSLAVVIALSLSAKRNGHQKLLRESDRDGK
jgi:hypothetical protein